MTQHYKSINGSHISKTLSTPARISKQQATCCRYCCFDIVAGVDLA